MLKVSTIIIKKIRRYGRNFIVNLARGKIIRRVYLLLVRKLYRFTLKLFLKFKSSVILLLTFYLY